MSRQNDDPFSRYKWNEEKRQKTVKKHRIDFADAKEIFRAPHIKRLSPRKGEERWIAIGDLEGMVICVAYKMENEGQTCRIITARRARKNEQREYRQLHRRRGG